MSRLNIKPPGRCIFCQNFGMTNEHLWPKWLRSHLPKRFKRTGYISSISAHSDAGLEHENVAAGRLHGRHGHTTSAQLNIVCKICNNTWMSHINDTLKPVLLPLVDGEWHGVPDEQASLVLATWATLFTMVAEFADPRSIGLSQDQRNWFRENKRPRDDWQMWIGQYSGTRWCGTFWHTAFGRQSEVGPTADGVPKIRFSGQTTLFAAGKVIFQTFAPSPDFNVTHDDYTRSGFFQFWPPTERAVVASNPIAIDDHSALNIAMSTREKFGWRLTPGIQDWITNMPLK